LLKWLSFFSVFFFWKIFFEREFQDYNQQMQDTPCIYGSGYPDFFFLTSCGARKRSKKNAAIGVGTVRQKPLDDKKRQADFSTYPSYKIIKIVIVIYIQW
jgi:hypothetical protein